MDYDEFKRRLGRAGMSLKAFATLLQLNPTSLSNYSRVGEVPIHMGLIVTLIGELVTHRIDLSTVLCDEALRARKPRNSVPGFKGNRQPALF